MTIFDPASTQQAVHHTLDAALSAIPEGRNHALIIDGTKTREGGQAEAIFATRVTKNDKVDWTLAAGIAYDGHNVRGGFETKVSW